MDEKKAQPTSAKDAASAKAPATPAATATPAAAPAGKTNGVAIAAIIFAFLFPLVGLILGIIALSQIKKKNEGGKGLAVTSIVLSVIFMVAGLMVIFGAIIAIQRAAKESGVNINGNGSVQVTGKNGESLQLGGNVKLPDGFPSDVPIYKPADLVTALKAQEGYNVTLATDDDAQKVLDFYKSQLPANGWTDQDSQVSFGVGAAVSFTKGDQQLLVLVSSDKNGVNGKKTGVNLTVANKGSSN